MSKSDDLRLSSLFANENEKITFYKSIKIAFIGYANDEGVLRNGGRVGASEGPGVVRTMLKKKGCIVNEEYNVSLGDVEIKDFGDSSGGKDLKSVHKSHQEVVQTALSENYIPIVVGGGNDQSYPNFLALIHHINGTTCDGQDKKLLVVNIDAHLDVRPLLDNEEPHSGSPFRQMLETDIKMPLHFTEFGCQGSQCSSNHVAYLTEKGGKIIWLKDLHGSLFDRDQPSKNVPETFEDVLRASEYSHSFVSFDIDSIRYSDCPGVSCPSPIGLTAEEALAICYRAGKCSHVTMMDLSEFNPAIESYMTSTLIANMIYYFIAGVVQRKISEREKK